MDREKAPHLPPDLLNLFDRYQHGGMSRRDFVERAKQFTVAGVTGAALLEMLEPANAAASAAQPDTIDVKFIAGFGPIVRDVAVSRKLYAGDLGISFAEGDGGYLHTEALKGAKAFALWPLSQAAQSCFGNDAWPQDTPVPQAWLEFEVDDVEHATRILEQRGHRALLRNKKEPWGQTVSRFLSPEGLLIAVTFTPALRAKETEGKS